MGILPSEAGLISGFIPGSVVTIVFVLLMLLCYYLFPITRSSTAQLVVWRSAADLGMAINMILAEVSLGHQQLVSDTDCLPYSLAQQFCIMASGCWFMTMSAELWRAVQFPFNKHPDHHVRNHILVWSTSALSTFLLWTTESYGVSSLQLCWIAYSESFFNVWLWMLFYVPTMMFYFLSILVLVHVSRRFSGVSKRSHVTRRKVMRQGTVVVIAFCAYWTVLGVLYSSGILRNNGFEPGLLRTRVIVWLLALRGSVDLLLWMHVTTLLATLAKPDGWNLARTQLQEDSGLDEMVVAIRRDWMLFTSEGIVQQARAHNDTPEFVRHDRYQTIESSLEVQPHRGSSRNIATLDADLELSESNADAPRSSSRYESAHELDSDDSQSRRQTDESFRSGSSGLPADSDLYDRLVDRFDQLLNNERNNVGTFKDYAPLVFREIRTLSGITHECYCRSFVDMHNPQTPRTPFSMTERFSEGKSGMFLYFTPDRKYMVKQMDKEDYKTLKSILPSYLEHLKLHPHSLVMRCYGCHSINVSNLQKEYFGVFQNLFAAPDTPPQLLERYDLKGSSVARDVLKLSAREASVLRAEDERFKQCLKDTDLITLQRSIPLLPADWQQLVHQVKADCSFFENLGIMDYSMLLGVANAPNDSAKYQKAASGAQHVYYADGRSYSFGMIDILQRYTCGKMAEGCLKRCICKGDGISCRPPEAYARRFELFCERNLFKKVENASVDARAAAEQRVADSLATMATLTNRISSLE